jgi:putative Mn2+ efflux pump MntP
MTTLLLLGLALGFDSFRVSLGLGGLRVSAARRRLIPLSFGLCDGVAPLVGLLLGRSLTAAVGRWTEYLAPFAIGGYGLYVIYVACRRGESEREAEGAWVVLGLPLTLSLDNFAAGGGLGLLQFPALLSAAIIGAMSGLMSLAGLRLGGALARRLPFDTDLAGGVALLLLALAIGVDIL